MLKWSFLKNGTYLAAPKTSETVPKVAGNSSSKPRNCQDCKSSYDLLSSMISLKRYSMNPFWIFSTVSSVGTVSYHLCELFHEKEYLSNQRYLMVLQSRISIQRQQKWSPFMGCFCTLTFECNYSKLKSSLDYQFAELTLDLPNHLDCILWEGRNTKPFSVHLGNSRMMTFNLFSNLFQYCYALVLGNAGGLCSVINRRNCCRVWT